MLWNGLELPESYFHDDNVYIIKEDCRDITHHIPDKSVDLTLTDPPYGINAYYGEKVKDGGADYWDWLISIIVDCRRISKVVAFTHKVKALSVITDWDWVGIWNKPYSSGTRMGNSNIVPHYEPIFLYGIHSLGVHSKYTSDVFTINPAGGGQANGQHGREVAKQPVKGHRFTKPEELMVSLINAFPSGIILDPFLGSGTTAVVAKQLNRKCVGIEISEEYCELATIRYLRSLND